MKKQYSIDDFRRANPGEVSGFGGHGILTYSPGGISPFIVYNFLKKNFGQPDHMPSDRTTWEFVLKGPRVYLAVHDWKLHDWNIAVRLSSREESTTGAGDIHKYDEEARADANILLQEITKYAKTVDIPVTEHSHQFIENTYKISYYYGEHFLQSLKEPEDASVVPELSQSFTHLVSFEDSSEAWASTMAFILSVEAMFNILFEIYLKKEIREDEALRQHVFRLSLQDKWLLSASLCTCFEKPLSRKCRGYQSLKRLIGIRNNWAHAIVSDEMRTYFVQKDDLTFATKKSPIYREKERAYVYPLISSVDCISAGKVKNDADTIKSEILDAMKTNIKRKFRKALEQQYILLFRDGTLAL